MSNIKNKNENQYALEIKAYAKSLYLILDDKTGKRKYSCQAISDKIKEMFGEAPNRMTINTWAKAWEDDLELKEVMLGKSDADLFRFKEAHKEIVSKERISSTIINTLKASLIFHNRRMQKYGRLEDMYLTNLLENQALPTKEKLYERLLEKDHNKDEIDKIETLFSKFKLQDLQRGVVDSNKTFLNVLERMEKWICTSDLNTTNIIETKIDDIWEFEPVDAEEFLDSDEFLGSIKNNLFNCVKQDFKNIFYGNPRKILEKRRYKEIMFKEAYGTGKSIRAALISCYITYLILCLRNPAEYFNLMRGSKITITNVSVSRKQAKDVVFFKLKGMFDSCPWFRNNGYSYDPNNKLELRFDPADSSKIDINKIYKNVYVTPGSSSEFSAVGYDVICAIIDEATAYGVEGGKDKAEIIYETFRGRVSSRFPKSGMLIMAGNPHHVDDFLERRLQEAGDDPEVYIVRHRSIWEAKMPNYEGDWFYFDYAKMKIVDEVEQSKKTVLKIPIPYIKDFETAPEISTRNLAGISLESIHRFISNVDKIDEMFVSSGRANPVEVKDGSKVIFNKNFVPINKGVHAVHVDVGVTNDACAITLGHICDYQKNNPYFYVDCIIRLKGSQSNPTILEDVRQIIYKFSDMGFNIGFVSFDGYQSTDSIQILKRKGYDAYILSVDKKMAPYINLRQALYEDRINCPYHDFLKNELKNLENVNDKKVDHPIKGSKDVADSLCGMLSSLVEKVPIESIESDFKDCKFSKIVSTSESKEQARTPEEVYDAMLKDLGENCA